MTPCCAAGERLGYGLPLRPASLFEPRKQSANAALMITTVAVMRASSASERLLGFACVMRRLPQCASVQAALIQPASHRIRKLTQQHAHDVGLVREVTGHGTLAQLESIVRNRSVAAAGHN